MKVKIRRIGNGQGITLSKDLLHDLGASIGDELFVVKTPTGVQLSRFDPEFDRALEASRGFMRRYPNALKKLAE
jgi:putative addiction module antidote